jgi:Trk K+ transport system NAD-binding subunit
VGIRVIETLRAAGIAVVVIEKVEGSRFLAAARQKKATVLLGDGTLITTLQRAHTETARALVAATSSDLANVEMALLARELNPKLRVVLRLDDDLLADALRSAANIRYALGLPHLIAPAFVAPLFGDRVLGLCWLEAKLHLVMEIEVEPDSPLAGQTPASLRERLDCQILSDGPPTDTPLQPGQRLLTILPITQVGALLRRSA